jgi:hypothetical protein
MTTPNFTAILTAAHEAATDAVAGLPDGEATPQDIVDLLSEADDVFARMVAL